MAQLEIGKIREMSGVSRSDASEAMRLASHKLPTNVRFLVREGVSDGDR